jgi:hypothetical protein
MKPHKHAELIKAWADGAEIQYFDHEEGWKSQEHPAWYVDTEYRIKPEPKPDVVMLAGASTLNVRYKDNYPNLKLTFDGETRELKSAEVLK